MRFIVILFLVVGGCFGGNITDFQSLEKFIKDGQAKGYFPKKILVTQGFDTTVLEDVSLNFSKTHILGYKFSLQPKRRRNHYSRKRYEALYNLPRK